jgi:hypothetical protein
VISLILPLGGWRTPIRQQDKNKKQNKNGFLGNRD